MNEAIVAVALSVAMHVAWNLIARQQPSDAFPLWWAPLKLYAGFNHLMAIPHLLIWGPLQVMLLLYLAANASVTPPYEAIYVSLVLIVNGISLCFDLLDSWRWYQGGREVF